VANDRSQTFNVSRVAVREDDNKKPKARCDKGGKWVKNPKDRNRKVRVRVRVTLTAWKRKADEMGEEDIKDRYYTPQEYAALSPIQQSKLHKLRENHSTRQAAATLTELKAEIAELKAACETTKDIDTLDKPASNRNNLALKRTSKGQ
jgi:Lon protease-like protein